MGGRWVWRTMETWMSCMSDGWVATVGSGCDNALVMVAREPWRMVPQPWTVASAILRSPGRKRPHRRAPHKHLQAREIHMPIMNALSRETSSIARHLKSRERLHDCPPKVFRTSKLNSALFPSRPSTASVVADLQTHSVTPTESLALRRFCHK